MKHLFTSLPKWSPSILEKVLFIFFFKDFIYLFMIVTKREREAETQAEGEAGSMKGARRGIRSRVSRITPWAKGRRQTAEPPRDPGRKF